MFEDLGVYLASLDALRHAAIAGAWPPPPLTAPGAAATGGAAGAAGKMSGAGDPAASAAASAVAPLVERLYTGHGPPVLAGATRALGHYLNHRRGREAQVAKLLATAGAATAAPWGLTSLEVGKSPRSLMCVC